VAGGAVNCVFATARTQMPVGGWSLPTRVCQTAADSGWLEWGGDRRLLMRPQEWTKNRWIGFMDLGIFR